MLTQYPCPICNKRSCDSSKSLRIAKLSKSNEAKADVIIKCQNCKNALAVKINKDSFATEQMSPLGGVLS